MFNSKKQRIMSAVVFGVYLLLLTWLILFKFSTNFSDLSHIRNINLIPFGDSTIINGHISIKEIVYNILVFVPLGVYVSIYFDKLPLWEKIISSFVLSVIFETIQYLFSIGASDITDVIGNTFGGIIGIGLFALLYKMFKGKSITIINIVGITIEIIALTLIIIMTM